MPREHDHEQGPENRAGATLISVLAGGGALTAAALPANAATTSPSSPRVTTPRRRRGTKLRAGTSA